MELFIFYCLFLNASMFLAYIQFRGMMGKKKNHANRNRFKFDALDYYETDIEWSSFQFVPIGLCITGILVTAKIGRDLDENDYHILGLIIFERVIQFFLMSPFRDQNRALVEFKPWKWAILGLIQLCAIYLFQKQNKINVTSSICILDTCVFILQFMYYYEFMKEQSGGKAGPLAFLMTRKFQHVPRIEGQTKEEHIEHFIKIKYKSLDSKTDTEKFINNEVKIQKDIYSFAYAAIIHPQEAEDFDPKKKYLPRISLLNEERNTLYMSAILVTLVQASTILLIVVYFGEGPDGKGVKLIPAQKYYILIPRLISSIMMHLNVEADMR